MRDFPSGRLLHYAAAAACIVVSTVLTLLMGSAFATSDYALFLCAVIFSAWYGGLAAGLLSTVLSVLAIHYFFIPSRFNGVFGRDDLINLGVFVFISILISTLDAARRRAEAELRKSYELSEAKVHERTAELEQANKFLSVSEELHRITLSNISDAVFITNDSGTFTYMCPNAAIIFGHSTEEIAAQSNISSLLGSLLVEPGQLRTAREITNIDLEIRDKAGRSHVLLVTVKSVSISGGSMLYTCRDITERRRFEHRQQTQFEVTRVLSTARSLQHAAPELLRVVCEGVGWDFGDLWTVDPDSKVLRCQGRWHVPDLDGTKLVGMNTGAEIAQGEGLAGQVWSGHKPIWITNVSDMLSSVRVPYAAEADIRSAVGFPIKSGEGVLGVIDFLSREQKPPDEALLAILADIGSQIGHFAERRRAEEALLASEEQYRSFFERNLAGAFRSTLDGSVLDCNDSFAQILGYARRENVVNQEKLTLQLDETRDLKDRELSIERKDGSRVWVLGNIGIVERRGQQDLIEGTLVDITARKQAESTVRSLLNISEKLNSTLKVDELMDALMAEVMKLTGADSGCSGLRSHESLVTHRLFQKGEAFPFEFCWPAGVGWAGWLLIHKVPYLTNDALNDAQILPELRDTFGIRSGLSVPILDVDGEVIGFFELHNKRFTASDQTKLVGVSQIASIAIQNALAYQRLQDAESDLRQLSGRLLHLQDEERRRIARDLHETVAQSLAALKMNLAIVEKSKGALDKRASCALEEIRSLLENCIREIRTLSYLLHPPLLDESGLPSALRWYTEGFEQRSGVRVNLQIPANLGRLSQEMETTLFRIVQECLTNIHRHSGSSTATIVIRQNAGELVLEVKDEGRGMPPRILDSANEPAGAVGVGIAGMRERVKQLGGQMEIQSGSKGTIVKAVLRFLGGAVCQER